ncbi:MAG: hypothetical protein HC877_02530 [Thioploca sp.]|nr:hypothetical protein [Thioploca sp.]
MFVRAKYDVLVHSFLSTLSVLSLLVFPTVISAHPNYNGECSTCHASTEGGEENTVEFITAEDTTESITEEDTTEATIEEDTITPIPTIEEDITTTPTIEVDMTESTPTITTSTIPPTTTEDIVEVTTETNTAEPTTVLSDDNVAQVITPLDLNGDGQITQDEVQALQSEFFDSADTNADGFLTHEELQVAKKTPKTPLVGYNKFGCGAHFSRLDNDQDGLISKEEFVNNVPMFDQFDLDANGVILAKELTLKKLHHHEMINNKLYNNWINEKSYPGTRYQKNGNFRRH